VPDANHFFNEHTDLLIEHIHDYLNKQGAGLNAVKLQGLLNPPVVEEKPAIRARKKVA
jgi:hypothetical protein